MDKEMTLWQGNKLNIPIPTLGKTFVMSAMSSSDARIWSDCPRGISTNKRKQVREKKRWAKIRRKQGRQ